MTFVVATFYHFFDFSDYAEKRAPLLALFNKHHIKGSLLIAAEGFNGTISGTRADIDAVLAYLREKIARSDFEHKESLSATQPFKRAKVRLKKETISLGESAPLDKVGQYVEPKDWNALIADPDTVVLDARNWYETHMGSFERAVLPGTQNFRQLPAFIKEHLSQKKQAPIATFCTGGIRCEKLTAWMHAQGFEKVYHLKGGILKYLEEIPEPDSKWKGECYVFDERIAVGHGVTPSTTASICPACGNALTGADRKHSLYIEGISCPHCKKSSR